MRYRIRRQNDTDLVFEGERIYGNGNTDHADGETSYFLYGTHLFRTNGYRYILHVTERITAINHIRRTIIDPEKWTLTGLLEQIPDRNDAMDVAKILGKITEEFIE